MNLKRQKSLDLLRLSQMALKKGLLHSDKIVIKGGGGDKPSTSQPKLSANLDDITLFALQMAFPQRWEPGQHQRLESTHEVQNLIAITVETKHFSSLILLGSNNSKNVYTDLAKSVSQQLYQTIKSSMEKIYFIESFQLIDPTQLDWDFFVKMSDYCYMAEEPSGPVFFGYFRLEKTTDEGRFETRSINTIVEGEVLEQDIYLFFKKNNRYIKIAKKGEPIEKKKMDRLNSSGVKDLYMAADQGIETQQRRVRLILLELQEDYSTMVNAG